MSNKIKAIVLTSTSGSSDFSNLQVKEENYPKIEKDDQVIVRIKASGLNFAELMQRQGLYKPQTKTPYTPGFEAAGVVEETGSGVTDLKVNDRVLAFNGNGMWKEAVCLPRTNIIKIPDSMSFEDAAALLVNYVTAYQILFRMVNIRSGDKVLIHMAAGGVGFAATQLCKTVPNVTVIGTASAAKHDAIKQNGVTHAIDYTKSDYVQEVKKLYPDGIDVVFDPLNGDNAIKGFELLRPFGRICHYGAASITSESRSFVNAFKAWWKCLSVNSLDIINENRVVSGYHLGHLIGNPVCSEEMAKDISHLMELYQKGEIRVQHDSTFAYSKIGEAMKRMHSRQNVGKIILKPDAEFEAVSSVEQVKVSTDEQKVEPKTAVEPTQIVPDENRAEEVARGGHDNVETQSGSSEQIEQETSKLIHIEDQKHDGAEISEEHKQQTAENVEESKQHLEQLQQQPEHQPEQQPEQQPAHHQEQQPEHQPAAQESEQQAPGEPSQQPATPSAEQEQNQEQSAENVQ